jgi:hypothetical protein
VSFPLVALGVALWMIFAFLALLAAGGHA